MVIETYVKVIMLEIVFKQRGCREIDEPLPVKQTIKKIKSFSASGSNLLAVFMPLANKFHVLHNA